MKDLDSGRYLSLLLLVLISLSGCAQGVPPKAEAYLKQAGEQFVSRDVVGAVENAEKALSLTEKALGPNHCAVRRNLLYLAGLKTNLGNYDEAIVIHQRVLKMDERRQKISPQVIGSDFWRLGGLYRLQGNFEKAELYFKRGLAVRKKQYGNQHPRIASGYRVLGGLYQDHKYYPKAIMCFTSAYDLEKSIDPKHPKVGHCAYLLGDSYRLQGQMEKSEVWYLRALEHGKERGRSDHPAFAKYYRGLAKLYHATGREEEASRARDRVVAITMGGKP